MYWKPKEKNQEWTDCLGIYDEVVQYSNSRLDLWDKVSHHWGLGETT